MIYDPWQKPLRRSTSLFSSSTSRYLKMAHLCNKKRSLFRFALLPEYICCESGNVERRKFFFSSCFALALVCWYIVYLEFQYSSFFKWAVYKIDYSLSATVMSSLSTWTNLCTNGTVTVVLMMWGREGGDLNWLLYGSRSLRTFNLDRFRRKEFY